MEMAWALKWENAELNTFSLPYIGPFAGVRINKNTRAGMNVTIVIIER
jgi:hypothetical protein